MAAAPVNPPTPEDVTTAAWAVDHAWTILGYVIATLSGGGLLGAAGTKLWNVATHVSELRSVQQQHGAKLEKHDERIETLEEGQKAQSVEIAALPTQDRLDAVADRLERAMQAGFQNLTQIITQPRK